MTFMKSKFTHLASTVALDSLTSPIRYFKLAQGILLSGLSSDLVR